MKKLLALIVFFTITLSLNCALAAQVKVFVSDMNAVGIQNRDEMKMTLQTLLSSRLNNEKLISVAAQAEADVLVSGTYIAIGKVFSIDALARTVAGKTITRVYVQGETGEELIPAVGKLADKLSVELSRQADYLSGPVVTASVAPAVKSDIVKPALLLPASGDIIKSAQQEPGISAGWLSKRLEGAFNLMAFGKSLPGGGHNIFLADDRKLVYYRQADGMKLVAETDFRPTEKIIGLDAIEEGDGTTYLYVTIIRGDDPASQVWQVSGDKLVKAADDLPWMFRAFSLDGGSKKIYAQAMGRDADFFGDVYEVSRKGNQIITKKSIVLPRYGNIYTFNQFTDKEGNLYTVVLNNDGYLIVYDKAMKELWRSNDKFGGSELFFQKEDLVNVIQNGGKYRWVFMNQRIQVTSKGDVLVGKNEGFWVLGNARTYKKGAVFCMQWNGSSLEEKWRTRDTQNYMPDYFLDEEKNELMILQTVQRAGIRTTGASALAIKKIE